MRMETTKDILDHSKKFHELLAEYYHRLSENSDKGRLKLLLNYLEEREEQINETLSNDEFEFSSKVLKFWFPHSKCESKFEEMQQMLTTNFITIDKVIDQFLAIDDCLIELYSEIAESTGNEEVKSFFQNLIKLEENHKIKTLKNASQITDF